MLTLHLSFVFAAHAAPLVFPPVEILAAPSEAVGGGWLDGDHDGDDDLAVAIADPPSLRVYADGPEAPPIDVPLSFATGVARQVIVGKQPSGDTFVVVELEGGGVATSTWTSTGFGAGAGTPGTEVQLAGDVDGDGTTDLWLGGDDDAVWLSGSGALSPAPPRAHDLPLWSAQAVGDVNNDGHDDLLLAYGEYLDGAPYRPLRGHVGLYRGTPTGLQDTPLWELDGDDVSVADVFLGAAAVGMDGSDLVLTLTDLNDGCSGGEWLAVLHDAGSDSPVVHQIVDVPFDEDCEGNALVIDLVPGRSKAIVVLSRDGAAWLKWEDAPGELSMRTDAEWSPSDWVLDAPFTAGQQLAVLVHDVQDPQSAGVALWSALPEDPGEPPPPPTDTPPEDTGGDPQVDPQAGIVVTPEGTTCWCGVSTGPGGTAWWLAAAGLWCARTRRRAAR